MYKMPEIFFSDSDIGILKFPQRGTKTRSFSHVEPVSPKGLRHRHNDSTDNGVLTGPFGGKRQWKVENQPSIVNYTTCEIDGGVDLAVLA